MREERVYSQQRVARMSEDERKWAIDMVKTSNSLTPQEKEENLRVLQRDIKAEIQARIVAESADIDNIGA
ncbi:MAG: hypothetical protein GXP61_08190 [Epsilonproteobacteria bacterium]|nr:hypothetical protein [Campylobacterota bacterium]